MDIWWPPMDSNNNNWDLNAVVRGCRNLSSSTSSPHDPPAPAQSIPPPPPPPAIRDPFSSLPLNNNAAMAAELVVNVDDYDSFSSFLNPNPALDTSLHELEELCRPFVSHQQPPPPPAAQQTLPPPQRPLAINPRNQGKRKKNQQKKEVRQVPADGLPCDMWAWRKYGQKPIKGSPYPRGYYRCSSLKGCSARKQVERSCTDPTMLVITYTGEHNHPVPTHRNSLAGSSRNKFGQTTGSGSGSGEDKNTDCSPISATTDEMMVAAPGNDEEGSTGTARIGDFNEEMGFLDPDQGFGDGDDEFMNTFFSEPWQVNYSGIS